MTHPRQKLARGLLLMVALFPAMTPNSVSADSQQIGGIWILANVNAPVAPRWALNLETDFRVLDNFKETSEMIIQPGVFFLINPYWTMTLQYVYNAKPNGNNENRVLIDAAYHTNVRAVILSSRLRLTPRFIDDVGPVLRIRFRVGCLWNIRTTESYLTGWNELFFNANDQGSGPSHGFGQNRLYAGVGYHFGGILRGEIGYMWRYEHTRTPPNRSDHIIAVSFFFQTEQKPKPRKVKPHETTLPVSR